MICSEIMMIQQKSFAVLVSNDSLKKICDVCQKLIFLREQKFGF